MKILAKILSYRRRCPWCGVPLARREDTCPQHRDVERIYRLHHEGIVR